MTNTSITAHNGTIDAEVRKEEYGPIEKRNNLSSELGILDS